MQGWSEEGAPGGGAEVNFSSMAPQVSSGPNSHSPFCRTKWLHLPLPAFKDDLGEDLLILKQAP